MEPLEVAAEPVDEAMEYKVVFMELPLVAGELTATPAVAEVFPGTVVDIPELFAAD